MRSAMIARSASGSFRDALGTLDQLVAFGGEKVELDAVLELLGAADAELLFEAVDAVVAEDPKAVLLGVERLARSGRDPSQFARDLLAHLRHLLVTQTVGEVPDTFVVTATEPDRLAAQAERDRRRHPGAHDRRAGGGADRDARGRRRAHGGRARAAEGCAPGPRSVGRGPAAPDREARARDGGRPAAGPVAAGTDRPLRARASSGAVPYGATRGRKAAADAPAPPDAAEPEPSDEEDLRRVARMWRGRGRRRAPPAGSSTAAPGPAGESSLDLEQSSAYGRRCSTSCGRQVLRLPRRSTGPVPWRWMRMG